MTQERSHGFGHDLESVAAIEAEYLDMAQHPGALRHDSRYRAYTGTKARPVGFAIQCRHGLGQIEGFNPFPEGRPRLI